MIAEVDFGKAVREAFDDLNHDMVPFLARLSFERKFAMIGALADFARSAYFAQEQRAHPQSTTSEIRIHVIERMLLRGQVPQSIIQRVCRRSRERVG